MAGRDDNLLHKPIVIIGAPRSGTTMLTRIFRLHPQIAVLVEPRLTWRYGNDGKSDMLLPSDARAEVCRNIRQSFANAVREQGKQRLAEKTPSNCLRLGFVEKVLPDCKFLHTIRNGMDSVLAMHDFWQNKSQVFQPGKMGERLHEFKLRQAPYYAKEVMRRLMPKRVTGPNLWGPRIPGLEKMRREMDTLEICCLQWRMCVELACQHGRSLPSDRYMEYKIEQMTPDLYDSILSFCELDDCAQMRQYFLGHYKPDKPGARSREADPADLERIRRWIEPTLQWLGYA